MKKIENDNNVDRKTPEEIKKSLKRCGKDRNCHKFCSYWDIEDCTGELFKDALALIEHLERERDAAIEDIKVAATFLCQTCKKYHPAVIDGTKHFCDEIPADHFDDGAIACGMYEWRGVKEEKDENTRED